MRKKAPKKAKKKLETKTRQTFRSVLEEGGLKPPLSITVAPPRCRRMVRHDSLKWTCACGASGPVGRSADGIPYVNAAMLEHVTGETKIKVA